MEDEIRKLLHETVPRLSSPEAFRLELISRLDAAEQVKRYRDRELRRTRRTLRAVFAAGMLLGAAIAIIIVLHPVEWPELSVPDWLAFFSKGLPSSRAQASGWSLSWLPAALLLSFLAVLLPLLLTRPPFSRRTHSDR